MLEEEERTYSKKYHPSHHLQHDLRSHNVSRTESKAKRNVPWIRAVLTKGVQPQPGGFSHHPLLSPVGCSRH